MYPGVRIFKIWGVDQVSTKIVENHRKNFFTLIFIKFDLNFCVWGRFCHYFGGFWQFLVILNRFLSLRFTAISVIGIIAEFTAIYCIFQITEDYCHFSDSHCDFHPGLQCMHIMYRNEIWRTFQYKVYVVIRILLSFACTQLYQSPVHYGRSCSKDSKERKLWKWLKIVLHNVAAHDMSLYSGM